MAYKWDDLFLVNSLLNNKYKIIAALFLIFFIPTYRGFFAPFYSVADADTIYVGQALNFNGDYPQTYFDHPGYTYTEALRHWLHAARGIGFTKASNIKSLFALPVAEIGENFARNVYAARFFSTFLAVIFVFISGWMFWYLTRNRFGSWAVIFLLAASNGIAVHTIQVRCELFGMLLIVCSLFSLIVALTSQGIRRLTGFAIFGAACYCAALTKIQTIPILLLMPLAAYLLILATRKDIKPEVQPLPYGNWGKGLLAFGMIALSLLIIRKLHTALLTTPYGTEHYESYHLIILLYLLVLGAWIQFKVLKSAWAGVLAFSSIFAGASLVDIFFTSVMHTLEARPIGAITQFRAYAAIYAPAVAGDLASGGFSRLMGAVAEKFSLTVLLKNPIFFLIYLCPLIFVWGRNKLGKLQIIGVAGLFGTGILIDAICRLRYLASFYYIFFELFYVLAFAAAICILSDIKDQRQRHMTVLIGCALAALVMFSEVKNKQQLDEGSYYALDIHQPVQAVCKLFFYNKYFLLKANEFGGCERVMGASEIQ